MAKMIFAAAALGAALMATTASAATVDTILLNGSGSLSKYDSLLSLTAGTYKITASFVGTAFVLPFGNIANFFVNLTPQGSTAILAGTSQNPTTASFSNTFSQTFTLAAGNYTFGAGGIGNPVTVSATISSVPGPVAGAGLPLLLGLAGLAAWRRKSAVAA